MQAKIEDLFYGFVYGLISWFAFHAVLPTIAIATITSIFWFLGGIGFLGYKIWRRFLMPAILCIPFVVHGYGLGVSFSYPLQCCALSLGYGIPDSTDKGSWLGKIFGKWTRGVWFVILGLTISLLFIK